MDTEYLTPAEALGELDAFLKTNGQVVTAKMRKSVLSGVNVSPAVRKSLKLEPVIVYRRVKRNTILGVFTPDEIIPLIQRGNTGHCRSIVLPDGRRVKITATIRLFAFKGTVCVTCGRIGHHFNVYENFPNNGRLELRTEDDILMTADHIVPSSVGGSHAFVNLQPMCTICNTEKADRFEPPNEKEKRFPITNIKALLLRQLAKDCFNYLTEILKDRYVGCIPVADPGNFRYDELIRFAAELKTRYHYELSIENLFWHIAPPKADTIPGDPS